MSSSLGPESAGFSFCDCAASCSANESSGACTLEAAGFNLFPYSANYSANDFSTGASEIPSGALSVRNDK